MIILGLGSNLDDKLSYLRLALKQIKKIPRLTVERVSPIYISDALLPDNAPSTWNKPYLNLAIGCRTQLDPVSLLKELKNIESALGRNSSNQKWSPRHIDIDILAWEDQIIARENLIVPHVNLIERPFALWPLADIDPTWQFPLSGPYHQKTVSEIAAKWGDRFSGLAPFRTRQIQHRIDTPQLMGILNITPDSFSDGGHFLEISNAISHTIKLVNAGAEIIDIGAESTAPLAKAINPSHEWERLQPLLSEIKNKQHEFIIPPKISIDTRHSEVAEKALAWGVNMINDVSGLDDERMCDLIQEAKCDCMVMHHLSIPENRQHVLPHEVDVVKVIYEWAETRLNKLEQRGIMKSNIIFDPGIGFGKTAEQSLLLIKHINAFSKLGTRILVGHSRKSFLSLFTQHIAAERDIESMMIAVYLAEQNIDYIRMHDVDLCARGLKVMTAVDAGVLRGKQKKLTDRRL